MRAINEEERGILRLLFSVDFPGVDVLRAQVAAVREVEASCTCGCPSITPLVDRTTAPAARFRSLVPVELMEVARADGVPRTVLCFLDEDGYIGNLECVYYDETLPQWPDPQSCAVLVSDEHRRLQAVRLPAGAVVRPHDRGDRWTTSEFGEDGGFGATTLSNYREYFAPDGVLISRVAIP